LRILRRMKLMLDPLNPTIRSLVFKISTKIAF
jgi:hypothetical protein